MSSTQKMISEKINIRMSAMWKASAVNNSDN